MLNVIDTDLPDVKLLEPRVHGDARGFFLESYNRRDFEQAVGPGGGIRAGQPLALGARGAARPALPTAAARAGQAAAGAASGEIYDVALDMRRDSRHLRALDGGDPVGGQPAAGRGSRKGTRTASWCCRNRPTRSTRPADYYAPELERTVAWNDPGPGHPLAAGGMRPLLSEKDWQAGLLAGAQPA